VDGHADGRPSDGRGWYDEEPYGDPSRYGSRNDDRYGQHEGFSTYAEDASGQQTFGPADRRSHARRAKRSGLVIPDAPGSYDEREYGEREYGEREYGEPQYSEATYREAAFSDAPQSQEPLYQEQAYGDAGFGDTTSEEATRLSARDRQQLRERAAQSAPPMNAALASGQIATPMVPIPGAPGIPAQAGPVSGTPAAPMSPQLTPAALAAPTAAIPAGGGAAPAATYRSRRPGLAVLLGIGSAIVEIILLKVLLGNVFHSGPSAVAGTLGSLFALTGTPMTAIGVYALATGAATASGLSPGRAWLRTPLAYLPVGLILIVAAGLAA
jgi:hypothetical protein